MVKEQNYFGIAKYVKIAFIAKIRVFFKNVVVQENKNGHNSYIFNLNRLHDGSFRS